MDSRLKEWEEQRAAMPGVADAQTWLNDIGIASLFEQGIQALVAAKPDNAALFLSEFFADVDKKSRRAGGSSPSNRRASTTMVITVPEETPERMNAACLAPLLRSPDSSTFVKVVDVRELGANKGGSIRGAVHIPYQDVVTNCATLAKEWQNSDAIVFASAQSPDLDETAAIPIVQYYQQQQGKAPQVYTLMGGIVGWVDTYANDSTLVENYDSKVWGISRLKSAKGSLKGLKVAVPEAPSQMTCVTLSVMVLEAHQDSAIVDVRPSREGGYIPGSIHVPHDRLAAQARAFAEQWKDKHAVILLSYVSPDLDQTSAVHIMQALQELGSETQVFILIEGLKTWLQRYASNEKLVTQYEPHLLNEKRQSVLGSNGGGGSPHSAPQRQSSANSTLWQNRRMSSSGVKMQIDVPEAPLKIGHQEVAVMLRGSQGSPRRATKSAVVDVRDTREGGYITDSVNIPGALILENVAKYASTWTDLQSLIFVSAVSPDLDETVATSAMQWLHDNGSDARVFVLIGGMKEWVHSYHETPLVQGFAPAHWGMVPRARGSLKSKSPELEVVVPEAPLALSRQELALLVRSRPHSAAFVDVRSSQDGGTIPGCLHIPCDQVMQSPESVAAKLTETDLVVFCSAQQGDLDVSAAAPVLQALRDLGSNAQV